MIDQEELIHKKRSYLGILKARKIKNKVRTECFLEILSLIKDVETIERFCKEQISLHTEENENIEEEMGSVFNS
jgi:hypothetical protein